MDRPGIARFATPWAVAAGLALLTLALSWPGELIGDSQRQLAEIRAGRLTDWNPPLSTELWRLLGATAPPMISLQIALYWLGLGLLAEQLQREAGRAWSLALLFVGLTPMSLIYLGVVQKDTLLVALLVLASGLTLRFGRAAGVLPALLAMLTRANAVFAVPPLFVGTRKLIPATVLSIAIALAMVPASRLINHQLFKAERSGVEKSLMLFDIAGTEHHSGRRDLGSGASECYSPFFWDPIELKCGALARTPADLTDKWIGAILAEPLSYARHRIVHFNHNIYLFVPPRQDCVLVPEWHNCGPGGDSLLKDAIVRNAFLWPVTWLLIGGLMLVMPLTAPARMLALSGMLFGLAYLVVGVASGFRYFYWTELAVQLAIVWQAATGGIPRWRRIAFAVLALWAVGYTYRYLPLLV